MAVLAGEQSQAPGLWLRQPWLRGHWLVEEQVQRPLVFPGLGLQALGEATVVQVWPLAQGLPQPPQFFSSVSMLVGSPLQQTAAGFVPQTVPLRFAAQRLLEQVSQAPHLLAQLPQWASSLVGSMHPPLQQTLPAAQLVPQEPQ